MKKLLVLFGLMFVIFACSNDCMNVDVPQKNSNKNNQSNTDEPGKRPTTLQDVVDNANAGDEIDLSDYELTSYTATVNKKLTIKNGSLNNAKLQITAENVKLEKLTDLSVTSSSRLTINDSKLSNLLIGTSGETSRSTPSSSEMTLAMVTVTDSEIENVELNGFNSQLNITDTVTQIDDILISTKAKVILEAGSYDGMKDPTVTNGGEAVRVDMTKDTQLSVLSIYSSPQKLEYNIGDKIDLAGLIVMGTYSTDVETFKSGGWKSEGADTITKYEEYEKDYTVEYDFSTAGVSIVTVTSTKYPEIKCNFHVFVKELQNSGTSQPEKEEIEITKIELRSFGTPKTLYKVGEKLDLSCYQVVGTYNGFEINLPFTSEPANGTPLTTENTQITFYYNGKSVGAKPISVTQPYTVTFKDGEETLYTLEVADGELLKLPVVDERTGYTFDGWYIRDEKVTSKYIVKSNLELIAKWKASDYTITYILNDGVNSEKNPKGYDVEIETIKLENATKTGYTFGGWYTDKACTETNKVTEITKGSTGNITLYAQWTANKYTVKFDANGGDGKMANQTFTYDEEKALTANIFTCDGYTFAGWSIHKDSSTVKYKDKESVINLTAENNGTITLYAVWIEKGAYKIIYELDGGTNNPQNTNSYKDSSGEITLCAPTKTGYNFEGWYKDKDFKVKISAISEDSTGDITLYAQWTAVSYTIKYELNGGTNDQSNSSNYNVESGEITLADATKAGYTFGGWYTDKACTETNKVTEIKTGSTGNLTLYAKWTANTDTAYKVEHYQQNINDNQYSLKDTETKKGTTGEDTSATAKTYEGFTAQSVTQVKIAADGSTVVEIYYDRKEITLTLDLDGGSGETEIKGKYGATVTKPTNPTKNSYTFDSWYPALPETFPAESSITYTARWNELNAYYVSSDGKNNNAGTVSNPFATVQKAVNTAITSNDGETTYTIYVMSDITGGDSDFTDENKALINVVPGENETLHLKICGYNNADVTIDANQKGRVMYIGANAVVTLENITLSNGKIIDDVGGGVCIFGGNFTMSNGAVIRDCTSDVKESGGGGVYMLYGEFTMTGDAKISNCNANNTLSNEFCCGGGVYVADGEFNMSDTASIDDCNALSDDNSRYGGGVYLASGKFNMTGGSIKNCDVKGFSDYGGGVYVAGGEFTMSGGTISWSGDDYCAEQGGGVYVAGGNFNMSGSAKIEGCKTYYYGGGIYVANDATFTMSGGTISSCEVNNPKSGKSAYGGGVYQKAGTFTMTGGTISGCKVIISGDNSTGVTNGGGVYQAGGTFEMTGGTISGCTAEQGGGVYKYSGVFKMQGGTIGGGEETLGCTANQGGGVYLGSLGSSSISSGIISNCSAKQGGGVYYNGDSNNTFTMYSGEISKCTAEQGGGVYVNNGEFKMSGSAKIDKCEASERGGGVYQNGGRFEIFKNTDGTNNVIISNNTAKSGGGVCVYSGTFSMNSGSISGNKVKSNSAQGGGVLVIGNFFMNNGNITNNKLEYECIGNTLISGGAGVAVSLKAGDNGAQPKGAFTMSGGEISGNTITDNYNHAEGEDLFVISGGTFTHTGGTINNDKIYNANNQ